MGRHELHEIYSEGKLVLDYNGDFSIRMACKPQDIPQARKDLARSFGLTGAQLDDLPCHVSSGVGEVRERTYYLKRDPLKRSSIKDFLSGLASLPEMVYSALIGMQDVLEDQKDAAREAN